MNVKSLSITSIPQVKRTTSTTVLPHRQRRINHVEQGKVESKSLSIICCRFVIFLSIVVSSQTIPNDKKSFTSSHSLDSTLQNGMFYFSSQK